VGVTRVFLPTALSVRFSGDKKLMTLDMKHGGRQKIAGHLIGQLKKAMQR
jgi:hypothetical protein